MNVVEFEEKVWEIEGVRIVIRAPSNTNVGDYDYQNRAQETWRITQLFDNRIRPKLNNAALEVIAIQGDGEEPHGRVILRTLRQGYQ